LFGAIYYRLLFRSAPLTDQYADELVAQAARGLRSDRSVRTSALSANIFSVTTGPWNLLMPPKLPRAHQRNPRHGPLGGPQHR
jgi:hypothetical protein